VPTPKQVRHHYKRCRRYFYLLQCALNDAHLRGVINYKEKKQDNGYYAPTLESVCDAVSTARDRFEISTKEQLATALKTELMNEMKGIY
jgi:hypothetical protein